MNKKELSGIRYYLLLSAVLVSLYSYAGFTGWRFLDIFSSNSRHSGQGSYYHK
jgi:hypothetical protein